jgi:hypothetical protein
MPGKMLEEKPCLYTFLRSCRQDLSSLPLNFVLLDSTDRGQAEFRRRHVERVFERVRATLGNVVEHSY